MNPSFMRNTVHGATGEKLRAKGPGEPLYEFDEIVEKLGVSRGRVVHLATRFGGIPKWNPGSRPGTGKAVRYRLSDARKWWAALPEGERR